MSASDYAIHAAITQVRNTPQILQLLLASISPEDLAWKPQPSRFSISEVLAHMAHADEHCFALRIRLILNESNPALDAYDDEGFLAAGRDFNSDGHARLASFLQTRAATIPVLDRLSPSNASRTGHHPQLGALSASEILHEWAFHDLGHFRQIAELLRARCLFPNIGPYQSMYSVRP